jgi:hypothetical protein
MKITITPTKKTQETLDMMPKWASRIQPLQRYITYSVAVATKEHLLSKIPKGASNRDYMKAIKLMKVSGLGEKEAAYAVILSHKGAKKSKIRKNTSLIVIQPNPHRRSASIPKYVHVLAKVAPDGWPPELLPFRPDKKYAQVTVRKVSSADVEKARKYLSNRRVRHDYIRKLQRAGKRNIKDRTDESTNNQKGSSDLVMRGADLEFGSNPHWKPALIRAIKTILPTLHRQTNNIQKILMDPSTNPETVLQVGSVDGIVSAGKLTDYSEFINRLGVKL